MQGTGFSTVEEFVAGLSYVCFKRPVASSSPEVHGTCGCDCCDWAEVLEPSFAGLLQKRFSSFFCVLPYGNLP